MATAGSTSDSQFPQLAPATLDALFRDASGALVGLIRAVQKRLAKHTLAGELTAHLG